MSLREFDYEKEPVVSVVKKILTDAVKMKVSDIHFDPTSTDLSIKFRINGNLQEYTIAPESVKTNITTRIKILSGMNITDSMRPQTGTINFETEGNHHDMRVSSLPISYGEKIVVHISNYENNIKSLSKMGITPENSEKIKRLMKSGHGLVLITGTSSSGKTTTMYAMLKEVSSKAINIISIEDPVKMKLDGVNQVEIAADKGLTYKSALKHVMLQDPNIICIDNLIDDEVARAAIRASITGRLVLSSLYTKNAYTTIDTLLNMDIENYLLGSNLNGIISQRLVKQLCPKCKEKRKVTEYEKTVIMSFLNKEVDEIYYPKGCDECHNGYIMQIPIVEVVEISDEIRSAITNKRERKIIRELLYKNNNTILVDGFNKVIDGETSFNEIIRITDIKNDFSDDMEDIKEYILGNGAPTTAQILSGHYQSDTGSEVTEEININDSEENIDESFEDNKADEINESSIVPNDDEKQNAETNNEIDINNVEDVNDVEDIINQFISDDEKKDSSPSIEVEEHEENKEVETKEESNDDVGSLNDMIDDSLDKILEEAEKQLDSSLDENGIDKIPEEKVVPQIEEDNKSMNEEQININEDDDDGEYEIDVPTPIEAEVVSNNSTIVEDDDDDDDDDDFGYGEEYENSF